MDYKAVIFDLDGTLVDTAGDLAEAMNYALRHFGQPVHSIAACKKMVGNGVRVFASRALSSDSQGLLDAVLDLMKKRYHDNCLENSKLYDGVFDAVMKLKQTGLRLAVVTNKDQAEAELIVKHFFGSDTFEHIIGMTEGGLPKPDITATMTVVESMNVRPGQILYIGDSDTDMQTAANAGFAFAAVSWGYRDKEQLEALGVEAFVDTAEQILDLVA